MSWQLRKIISGGQTGVDQCALEAALQSGLGTGGEAPHLYTTSKGPMPTLLRDKYRLTEGPPSSSTAQSYVKRSIKNIQNSEATLAIRVKEGKGTDNTIGYCVHKRWRCMMDGELDFLQNPDDWFTAYWQYNTGFRKVIVLKDFESVEGRRLCVNAAKSFIRDNDVSVLNVAGHRSWGDTVWENRVIELLKEIFIEG